MRATQLSTGRDDNEANGRDPDPHDGRISSPQITARIPTRTAAKPSVTGGSCPGASRTMKTLVKIPLRSHFITGSLVAAFFFASFSTHAQINGTWINSTSNSTWGTTSNWSGGIIASGTDAIADFSTLDIAANRTVNLGASWTVGSLLFADATTASNNWALANGTGGPWLLTLATTTGVPTIQVTNQTTTVSAALAGSQGFAKTGAGSLTLTGTNTFTGGVTLSAGVLNFGVNALGTNLVTFTGNATLGWNGTNTLDLSSQIKIEDGVTATLATGANNVTFASPLQTGAAATASVTKTGGGTLTFTAVNTYNGTTRVNGGRIVLTGGDDRLAPASSILLGTGAASGIVQLGDTSTASSQTIKSITTAGTGTANAIVGGNAAVSTLTVNNSAAVSYGGLLGGVGTNENNLALAKSGSGTLTLSNASNTFTGGTTLSQGTLSFAAGALGTGAVAFASAATLQWATGNTSDLSTTNGLIIADGVTATLDANGNSFTLATALQSGPLGTAAVSKAGLGTVTITTANTYTGGTTIRNGTVVLASGDNRLSIAGGITIGNGANTDVTLQLGDASGPSSQTITSIATAGSGTNFIKGGNAAISTLTLNNSTAKTFSGTIGSGVPASSGVEENLALVKTGAGSLTLSGASNSFIGDVTVNGGALVIKSSNALGSGTKTVAIVGATNTPSLQLDGATGDITLASGLSLVTSNQNATAPAILNTAGNNIINGTLSPTNGGAGAGSTRIKVNAGTLTLNGDIAPASSATSNRTLILDGAGNGTINGTIANNGPITLAVSKDGAGTWTLTGSNSFSGAFTVINGTLQVDNTGGSGTGTSTVTVQAGAKLQGTGSIAGITNVQSGAFLEAATSTITGTLTFTNRLNLLDGSTTDFHLASVLSFDRIVAQNLAVGSAASSTALFRVFLDAGFTPVAGDTFDLIDWTTLLPGDTNLADNLDLSSALLDSGLAWDTSSFHSSGILRVSSIVPEPSRLMLLSAALLPAITRRKRQKA